MSTSSGIMRDHTAEARLAGARILSRTPSNGIPSRVAGTDSNQHGCEIGISHQRNLASAVHLLTFALSHLLTFVASPLGDKSILKMLDLQLPARVDCNPDDVKAVLAVLGTGVAEVLR